MNITQIVNTLAVNDGGPSRNSFELNVSLNMNTNIKSRLLWIKGHPESSVLANYDGSVGPFPVSPPRQIVSFVSVSECFRSVIETYKIVRASDVVIFHGYYLYWIPIVVLILRLFSVPYLFTPHGSLTLHQQKSSKKRKFVYDIVFGKLIRQGSLGFVTGSAAEAQELKKKFNHARVEVAGVGTALAPLYRADGEWGKPVRLLSLSRLTPKKRIDLTLAATKILRDSGTDVVLDIVGSGDSKIVSQLHELIENLNLTDYVFFHGQLSGKRKTHAYLAADLFVLPSDDENFGIGLAEALSHGIPVVASSAVASAEFLNPKAGRVIVSPSADDLADVIREILVLGDPALLRSSARACAVASYSWDRAVKNWIAALSNLGKGHG